MTTLQKVCGNINSQIVGLSTFQNDLLINATIHFLVVNNIVEIGLAPEPNYTFDVISGTIDRGLNKWTLGDKLIVVYSKCN